MGSNFIFGYGDVILTSIRPLQREGARCPASSLLAPSKAYRLIDFYDVILMMGVPVAEYASHVVIQTPHPMGCHPKHHTPWDIILKTTP
eukprot:COSAG01_NODE_5170_length_4436_cov_159.454923_2_plen_89_part_00